MISATIITDVSDFMVIMAVVVFFGVIWMIQRAKSCASALFDVLLIIIAGVLVVFFISILNKYF